MTLPRLLEMHRQREPIAMLTCYDASFAALLDEAGVDTVLVGDSLGMVVQGHATTLPVTLEHMAYHTACVARALRYAWLVVDMPFASYQSSPIAAYENAAKLMAAGAHMVKLEGGAWLAPTVRRLTTRGIPVCAHLGLTPQSVHALGGYRVQGRSEEAAAQLQRDALALQEAGASMLVLEMVPAALAAAITQALAIPTIGIGAGNQTSGQVLVLHDMLDVYPGRRPRFVRNFMAGAGSIRAAIEAYVAAVRDRSFPGPEHSY
ncbi:MAG: 3-methyl-2-oxobutanoate hydroxymethyltransferase [Sutterellaceae bacterium]|nr:3-methyl-2-oxobutanoate hydroxymethyltransferase [Burkholderiaceae bacterium]MDW8429219.1 3-methyl-2-oxobutanoate hydroxymethyltransferase [Sutterellaceae bacterium]